MSAQSKYFHKDANRAPILPIGRKLYLTKVEFEKNYLPFFLLVLVMNSKTTKYISVTLLNLKKIEIRPNLKNFVHWANIGSDKTLRLAHLPEFKNIHSSKFLQYRKGNKFLDAYLSLEFISDKNALVLVGSPYRIVYQQLKSTTSTIK